MAAPWSPHHLRLHRQLLGDPLLLPRGEGLLLAVSGGQDSMALTALLQDLRRLHGWRLWLWHGDHRWRAESAQQAGELAAWAETRQLPLSIDTWQQPIAAEAAAREWRYRCLAEAALRLGASHVVTGHTASDRAETALLNLARGSHRRGLASLSARRPLGQSGLLVVRPMLDFSRDDTAAICRALELPIWLDPSNADPRFSRNRIRREVMPVLQALHPGAERRISALAERLAAENQDQTELLELALLPLRRPAPAPDQASSPPGGGLDRNGLLRLHHANQRLLLQHWLRQATQRPLPARQLEALLKRLPSLAGTCRQQLAGGWQLRWRHSTLWVQHNTSPTCDDPIA